MTIEVKPTRRSGTAGAEALPLSQRGRAIARRSGAEMYALVASMRPRQWLKNGLVFLAPAFAVGEAWQPGIPASWLPLAQRAGLAFLAFCAVASAQYLFNDLCDIERDRHHPLKRHRPLASGVLSPTTAVLAASALIAIGATFAITLGWRFSLALGTYAALTLAYSTALKQVVLLDLLILASGFVLRAVCGALAAQVAISPWLYLCTLLGALLIAICKRRHEVTLLTEPEQAMAHRPVLMEYPTALLDQMLAVVAAGTVVAYALYTVTAPNVPRNHAMLLTVPFVLYGIFRYLYLVHRHNLGGAPEEVLFRDRPLRLTIVLWFVVAVSVLATARG
jgi:4-hydroxybenzoate polyprenyltransferase